MAQAKVEGQLAIDERYVSDAELEALLVDREMRAGERREAQSAYSDADALAKAAIDRIAIAPGEAIRVGRFRIEAVSVPGRVAHFEVGARTRITIAADE